MREKRIIVWFRNDLRLHDHEPLFRAASKTSQVVPVYCIDPRQFASTPLGFPKTGAIRAQFLLESIHGLRKGLQSIGSDLIVRVGKPEEIIPNLVEMTQAAAVYTSKEVTHEETSVESALEAKLWARKIPLEMYWQSTLFHIDDIPFPIRNIPDVFTDFRKETEKATRVRPTLPRPSGLAPLSNIAPGAIPELTELGFSQAPTPDPRAVLLFKGGETEGLKRLQTYFWDEDRLRSYKETRNGLIGSGYSTKLSCWLALGCVSPRKVYEEVRRYEQERVKNDSTYWLVFELLWRDFFRFIAKKYGSQIFRSEGIRNDRRLSFNNDRTLFQKWVDGETGIPFIDANMRELKYTGFLSNRGRQNVASFLAKDLKVNWTYGAMYFESQLLDYDVASNWCNWNYVVGVGNDPRENRYFNIIGQAKRYDPEGAYVKRWLPELEDVPTSRIHYAGDLSASEQRQYGVILGMDYPRPLIDYARWMA